MLVIDTQSLINDPETQSRVAAWVNDGVVAVSDKSDWSPTMKDLYGAFERTFGSYMDNDSIKKYVAGWLLMSLGFPPMIP